MLVPQLQGQTFKRVFRNESGEYILATFLVVQSGGKLKARLIATEVLSDELFTAADAKALPIFTPCVDCEYEFVSAFYETPVLTNSHSFFVSQPTRAPAFA
jgi:hypothetical protein